MEHCRDVARYLSGGLYFTPLLAALRALPPLHSTKYDGETVAQHGGSDLKYTTGIWF
jgi:hypothetical protein